VIFSELPSPRQSNRAEVELNGLSILSIWTKDEKKRFGTEDKSEKVMDSSCSCSVSGMGAKNNACFSALVKASSNSSFNSLRGTCFSESLLALLRVMGPFSTGRGEGGEEEGEEEVNNGPPLRFLAANLFRVQGTVARCLLDLVIEKKVLYSRRNTI